jgi:hypothetical protein
MIVALVIIGCDKADGGGNSTTPEMVNSTITPTTVNDDVQWTYVEMDIDELSFEDAFEIQYLAKGQGSTFWWRGNEYTTDLQNTSGQLWVRNSDDLDDHCYSNEWDECGICNGTGKITWYRDQDGDGLGDPTWFIKDCIYPSVDEE